MRQRDIPYGSLLIFFAAYILAGGWGQGLAIIPGITVTFWPPAGIFLASLVLSRPRDWPWFVAVACAAEMSCNAIWFHNPMPLALTYFLGNTLEAFFGAYLLQSFHRGPLRLENISEVGKFVLCAVMAAPMVGATVIASTDAVIGKHPFSVAWPLVWLGDATGLLVSAPLTIVAVHAWKNRTTIPYRRIVEALVLSVAIFAISALAYMGRLPSPFITLPLVLWTSARFHLRGAAVSIALLALASAVVVANQAPFAHLSPDQIHDQIVLLQAFLGISAASALLVAAIAQQYKDSLARIQQLNTDLEARVTERTARLAESEHKLRLFIENAPAAIAMFDRQMRYLAVSHKWLDDFGTPDDIIGQRHYDVFPELPEAWKEAHARGLAGEKLASDGDPFMPARGELQWIKWDLLPWYDRANEVGGIIIASENITEQRQTREAILDADQRKDEFLATLAHELRNPLTPIRTGIDILRHQNLNGGAAILDTMERQTGHLINLVDDLLDLSRITTGRIMLRDHCVEVQQAIQSAIETCRSASDEKRHRLVTDQPKAPIFVKGDRTRVAQIVANLVTNAIKYTDPGGEITVRLEEDSGQAVICVIDNGVGIEPSLLPTIWDLFSQVRDTIERAQGGLGVGLALVKRLVELHGGQATARSEGRGLGCTFEVRLPIVSPPEPLTKLAADPNERHPGPRRLLLIEDSEDVRRVMEVLLSSHGHEVAVAKSGAEALPLLKSFSPEIVICDIGLPEMNGHEIAKEIRKDPAHDGIVLIAVTGWGRAEDLAESRSAGFDLHLTKPVASQALLAAIESAVPLARTP